MINTTASMDNEFSYSSSVPGIVIGILGVVSNVLLLVAFVKDPLKCFRNSGTYLVMNLSVSDCSLCLLFLLLNISRTMYSQPILQFFISLTGGVSFISITSISIDRFFMVTSPIKHRILMKGKVTVLWISAIWIVNCVVPLPINFLDIDGTDARQGFSTFSVIVIMLSSVMYSCTYYKLKKQSRNIALQNSTEGRAQKLRILKEKRFLKTIIIIACIAFVCTVPFFVLYLFYDSPSFLVNDSQAFALFFAVSTVMFQMNFAVNPLIYILRLPNYRKAFICFIAEEEQLPIKIRLWRL